MGWDGDRGLVCRAIFRRVDFRLDPWEGAVEGLVHGIGLGPTPLGDSDDRPGDLLLLSLPFRSNSRSGTSILRILLKLDLNDYLRFIVDLIINCIFNIHIFISIYLSSLYSSSVGVFESPFLSIRPCPFKLPGMFTGGYPLCIFLPFWPFWPRFALCARRSVLKRGAPLFITTVFLNYIVLIYVLINGCIFSYKWDYDLHSM